MAMCLLNLMLPRSQHETTRQARGTCQPVCTRHHKHGAPHPWPKYLPDQLGANVLNRVLQLHFTCHSHTIVHNLGRAVLGLEHNIPPLGPQSHTHHTGQLVHTCLHSVQATGNKGWCKCSPKNGLCRPAADPPAVALKCIYRVCSHLPASSSEPRHWC